MSMETDREIVGDQRNEKLATTTNNNGTTANENGDGAKNNDVDTNTPTGKITNVKEVVADNDSNTNVQQKITEQVEVSGFQF